MVLYKDVGKVWETKESVESWGHKLLELQKQGEKAVTKTHHRKGSLTGACDRQSWDAVSLSNHPRKKLGDLYLTGLPSPVSCWYIPIARFNQEPESKRAV